MTLHVADTERVLAKLLSRYEKDERTGCWEWIGVRSRQGGYGVINLPPIPGTKNTAFRAHRIMWEVMKGPIPNGLWVLHKCDNPPCINPEHLFLGTRFDNIKDMDRKGRRRSHTPRGERNWNSKLTGDAIKEILESSLPTGVLAQKFAVHYSTIQKARKGSTWIYGGVGANPVPVAVCKAMVHFRNGKMYSPSRRVVRGGSGWTERHCNNPANETGYCHLHCKGNPNG